MQASDGLSVGSTRGINVKLYDYQLVLCAIIMGLALFGLHNDVFNLAEGIAAFALGIVGFIHAGIHLILED